MRPPTGLSGAHLAPDALRAEARDILNDRKFRAEPVPRPLKGVLEWVGERLRGLGDLVMAVLRHVPGPTWVAVAFLAIAIAGVLVSRVVSRPGGAGPARGSRGAPESAGDDPDDLEAAAAEAERQGELSTALRLRFRAGLLRLDERGAITFRPSLTTGEVRRLLGSETFDDLAATFEEVAYGGRVAQSCDVEGAREGWPRLLREARTR